MEKEIERYEREIDKMGKKMVEMESQNFTLQKGIHIGSIFPKDQEVGSYLDQVVQQKALELESQNNRLTTSLQQMQQDFKDLLIEVERLRQQVSERDSHIKVMVSEMQALPNL